MRNKTRMHTLASFIQHGIGSPSGKNQKRKIKCIQIRREGAKLSLFADDMILYRENPTVANKKPIRINK